MTDRQKDSANYIGAIPWKRKNIMHLVTVKLHYFFSLLITLSCSNFEDLNLNEPYGGKTGVKLGLFTTDELIECLSVYEGT